MIAVTYGVPGSGKTYYAVWWIKKRCLEEGDVLFRVRPNVVLITNLKLNLDSSEGYIYIEDVRDFSRYMDIDFWKANFLFLQGKKLYIVMDECQLFFYHYKDDPKVLFFLQYHRHLGVDILLITQTPKSLPAKVFELSEFLIEAVPRSVNPFSFKAFRYRVLHPFDRDLVLRRFHLAFDPVIFYLYQDMIYKPEEAEEKPKNAFTRYYVLFVSFLLLTVFLMFSFFTSRLFSPSVPSRVQAQSHIDYEDLVVEVPDNSKPSDSPKDIQVKPEEDIKLPGIQPSDFRIVVVKPSRADSPNYEDVLNPSVRVIEIP